MTGAQVIQSISLQNETVVLVAAFGWARANIYSIGAHGPVLHMSNALLDRGRQMLGKMHSEMAGIPEEDLYISIGKCIVVVIVVVAAHACDGTVSSENRCLVGNAVAWLVGNVNGIGGDTIPLHAIVFCWKP
jgi:hypothetical protein